jgi:sucrose-6-phosphate hydrolase SacC (GH32 family)
MKENGHHPAFTATRLSVMRHLLLFFTAFWIALSAFSQSGRELYRPEFHFSPSRNWMNDPNGMVYFAGEYHLFFQYNPYGIDWGNMSWGHAKSKDLVHWEHLPVAIPVENGVMAFSGCVVVDHENSSGFGINGQPPLVAVYTGAGTYQDQRLAFSTDSGLTWKTYAGNPVIDLYSNNFRDPKVIWHEPTRKWIMVVSLAEYRKIRFYASADLKNWEVLQDFGPVGNLSGVWECPDLFPLNVDEDPSKTKWVLVHSIGPGLEQYFIGDFDGRKFTWEKSDLEGILVEDFEKADYNGWTATGNAFGEKPVSGNLQGQQAVSGYLGYQLVNSFRNGDGSMGRLLSPPFLIQKNYLSFLIGGGNHPAGTYIKLMVNDKVVATATGMNDEFLEWKSWNVQEFIGQQGHIAIVDSVSGGWGHINVDHIIQTDLPVQTPRFGKVDFGKDFYASQSFSDVPGNRRIWMAWMNNWSYAGEVPTTPWRGIMSTPREVQLITVNGEVRLVQKPVPGIDTIALPVISLQNKAAEEVAAALKGLQLRTYRIRVKTMAGHTGGFTLKVRKGTTQETVIAVDTERQEIRFDRSRSGALTGNQIFSDRQIAPLMNEGQPAELELLVDNCSVEIFANQGLTAISNQIFPDSTSTGMELTAPDSVRFEYFEVSELKRNDRITYTAPVHSRQTGHLLIFPNPAREGKINLRMEGMNPGEIALSVFRYTGEKVAGMILHAGQPELAVDDFPGPGLYAVSVRQGSTFLTGKIIILK